MKKLPIKYKLLLLDIFNEIYRLNCYPEDWSKSFVIFINKQNNRGVRPISLCASLCKVFESLVKIRLQCFCEYNNVLSAKQSGFRRGRSYMDNLSEFGLSTNSALSRKRDTMAAFLDVQRANDNVRSDILLDKLARIGFSSGLVSFIRFSTHSRRIYAEALGDEFRFGYKGVPQGGVLSPLLYLIYVKDIATNIPKSASVSQFADDIDVYSSFGFMERAKVLVSKVIGESARIY